MGADHEWRCTQCGKLLGKTEGDRLHVRFARHHEYLMGFPVTAMCWSCGGLNEYHGKRKEEDRRTAMGQ